MPGVMTGAQPTADYYRYCPGEEQFKLSNAICRGRRRTNYPKCHGCQFNDDEAAAPAGLPGVGAAAAQAVTISRTVAVSQPASPQVRVEDLFRTHDIVGSAPQPLTADFAWRIGHATAQYLQSRLRAMDRSDPNARALIVAHDARPHSAALLDAFIQGVHSTAMDVIHLGCVDAPMLTFAVQHLGAGGGVYATGGCEPADRHGFVICGARAMPISVDTGLTGIRDIASRVPRHITGASARHETRDLSDAYHAAIRARLRGGAALAKKTTIAFDAGHGVMGRRAVDALAGVRNLRLIPLNDTPAEEFTRDPNPTHPEALTALRKCAKSEMADFAVAFSPDGSLCTFLDDKAAPISCDVVAALIARDMLQRRAGDVFVFDHRFNSAAIEEITQAGGAVLRERVGPSYIRKRMAEVGAVFGADLDGRFYFRDAACAESPLFAIIELINLLSSGERSLASLARPLLRSRSSGEIRFHCSDPGQVIQAVTAAHPDAELERIDGLTVKYPEWRFNLRSAGSPPTLRLTLEARNRKLVDQRIAELSPLLGERATGCEL